jgi:hypothetical protein
MSWVGRVLANPAMSPSSCQHRRLRFGGNDLEALSNYFAAFSPVDPPPTDRVNDLP